MDTDRLTKAVQENLIVLLCYSDEHFAFIRNVVDADLFEGVYFEIARRVYGFIDDYKKPPKDHVADLFDDILEGDDEDKRQVFVQVLSYIHSSHDKVNVDYTLSRLRTYIRAQRLKKGIMGAAQILQRDEESALDEAEQFLQRHLKTVSDVFDPGLRADDLSRGLRFLEKQEECFPTNIDALDIRGLGPVRKGLHLLIAGAKAGKSFWLCHLAKSAVVRRYKVLYVTLELSEEYVAQRIYQSFLGIPKRAGVYTVPKFVLSEEGTLDDIEFVNVDRKVGLNSDGIETYIANRSKKIRRFLRNLIIKEFPGALTVRQLDGYLEGLEKNEKFVPDLILLDYPDLMITKSRDYRHELGAIYKDLRGLAAERNLAIAAVTQSNREGVRHRKVREYNVSEDFSKIATADCVLTLSKTEEEEALGLGRLFVAAGRTDEGKFEILISQCYPLSQFLIDSYYLDFSSGEVYKEVIEREKHKVKDVV